MKYLQYPICERCKTEMVPDWFLEDEFKIIDGSLCKTGRVRRNVNFFYCPCCFDKAPTDDSFASPWRKNSGGVDR